MAFTSYTPQEFFYCDRDLVELIFGTANIVIWANLENADTEDANVIALIDKRVSLAINTAEAATDDRLRGTRYKLPLNPVSIEVSNIVAGYAGALLYDGRGALEQTSEGEADHHLAFYKKRWQTWVQGVIAGKIELAGQTDAAVNTPSVG